MGEVGSPLYYRVVAATVILLNLAATLYHIKKARAARPPRRIDDTIIGLLFVVALMLPFLVVPRQRITLLMLFAPAIVISVVQLRRVLLRSE
jgi:hypothetical protein